MQVSRSFKFGEHLFGSLMLSNINQDNIIDARFWVKQGMLCEPEDTFSRLIVVPRREYPSRFGNLRIREII
jgi:hypothetical protein